MERLAPERVAHLDHRARRKVPVHGAEGVVYRLVRRGHDDHARAEPREALGHHRQHPAMACRVAHGCAHIADIVRDEHVRVFVQFVDERISRHLEVLAGSR